MLGCYYFDALPRGLLWQGFTVFYQIIVGYNNASIDISHSLNSKTTKLKPLEIKFQKQ